MIAALSFAPSMAALGRYCCKRLSGYDARNIDSSPGFAWQGRFKTLSAEEETLRGEPIQLTFATLSAQMRSADRVRKRLLFGVDRTYCGRHETDAFDPGPTYVGGASLRAPFVIPKTRQR